MLIRGAKGILTGLSGRPPGAQAIFASRKTRSSRSGRWSRFRIEQIIDATGCVVSSGPRLHPPSPVSERDEGRAGGIDLSVESWLPVVPYRFWNPLDADTMRLAARVGMTELLLSGTSTIADHHYLFAPGAGLQAGGYSV